MFYQSDLRSKHDTKPAAKTWWVTLVRAPQAILEWQVCETSVAHTLYSIQRMFVYLLGCARS